MARNFARISTALWGDEDFKSLTSEAQRCYVIALSQPGLSLVGVVPYQPRRWATFAADSTEGKIRRAVDELEAVEYILVDRDTEELLVRSFMRHDRSLSYTNTSKGVANAYHHVASPVLRRAIRAELRRLFSEKSDARGWEIEEVVDIVKEAFAE